MRWMLVVVTLALGACNNLIGIGEFHTGGGDDIDDVDGGTIDAMPAPQVAARYVVSAVQIPTNNTEATALGRDLDDDGAVDNQLGMIFAAFQSSDILVVFQASDAIATGDAIWLHELYAYDLGESSIAQWASYDGEPEATPDYTGNGVFAVDTTAPTDHRIDGTVTAGSFLGEHGTGRLVLGVGTGVVHADLVAAEAAVSVTADGCSGVFAGGIPDTEVQSRVIPALATAAQQVITDDPGCPSACGQAATDMLGLFDANGDAVITLEEFATNSLIVSLFAPDLDLIGPDDIFDTLSIGVGITCVRGSFATD